MVFLHLIFGVKISLFNQFQFFLARHLLNLRFPGESLPSGSASFLVKTFNGRVVAREPSGLFPVLGKSSFKIIGNAGVQIIVFAFQYVDDPVHKPSEDSSYI